jgi:hypothetical protein
MKLDVLSHVNSDDIMGELQELRQIEAFSKYMQDPEGSIPITPLFVYVVLLYSRDSFLFRPPLDELRKRKIKAATLAGLNIENETIKEAVVELMSEKVVDLILGYLIYQASFEFTELCVIEAQIEESQRVRMRGFGAEKDKDLVQAVEKKAVLTTAASNWYDLKKKYEKIIFADHSDIKEKSKRKQRISLELYAN